MNLRSVCLAVVTQIALVVLGSTTTEPFTSTHHPSEKLGALLAGIASTNTNGNASVSGAEKLDAPEVRYRILARFKEAFFCDPDAYPVGLSPDLVRKRGLEVFRQIEKDQEAFRAIAHHLGLSETARLSDEQKLSVYKEFKKLRGAVHLERSGNQYKFTVGLKERTDDISIHGLFAQNGTIIVLKRENTFLTCPICLAAGTRIYTPDGWVLVQTMKPGDRVWTLDAMGRKVIVPVLKTSASPVSLEHCVVHLVLGDGREVWASPGHPTADGRTLGQLEANGTYDGSWIKSSELTSYQQHQTYDLLPAGTTGLYWANGILLASTLRS